MQSPYATTPDGSPVELYALLSPDGEPELIHAAIPADAAILELGCGAGRVTHPLLALGHPVTAVDQSEAMLRYVRGAETVQAAIETLDLGRRFDCVVLGSYLVNTTDAAQRDAFLRCCRRHLAPEGSVLIEQYDPAWAATLAATSGEHLGVTYAIYAVRRDGPLLSAVMEYRVAGRTFHHPFTARVLRQEEMRSALQAAGLAFVRWLGPGHRWAEAVPESA
jgi:SAM-dependent methyltransferase